MVALLKTTQIQEPSSATVNLTLDASGGVTVGQNLTISGGIASAGLPIKGSTSGTVTLVVPAVAGTNTVTVAAQTGTLNAAGPAFSAYASASQTVTATISTKVAINTENFDTNSNFDTTNYRFTPTVEGYYQVNGIVAAQGATTITTVLALLYKNGSAYRRHGLSSSFTTATPNQMSFSEVVYMNGSTDYLELYGQVNGTGTLQFIQTSAVTTSAFSACLVRGA